MPSDFHSDWWEFGWYCGQLSLPGRKTSTLKCMLYKTPEAAASKTERGFLTLGVCKTHSRQPIVPQYSPACHILTNFRNLIKFRSLITFCCLHNSSPPVLNHFTSTKTKPQHWCPFLTQGPNSRTMIFGTLDTSFSWRRALAARGEKKSGVGLGLSNDSS